MARCWAVVATVAVSTAAVIVGVNVGGRWATGDGRWVTGGGGGGSRLARLP